MNNKLCEKQIKFSDLKVGDLICYENIASDSYDIGYIIELIQHNINYTDHAVRIMWMRKDHYATTENLNSMKQNWPHCEYYPII